MSPTKINTYYNPFINHIIFPTKILNKPFYSIKQSKTTNYNEINTIITHEINHAFNNNNTQFNEKNNLNL